MKEISYEPISEKIMSELESYFINFELTEDETTEDKKTIIEKKRAEDDPTENQIPAKKGICFFL